LEAFKQASQYGRSIVCFTEPAKFTAMFNAAKIAREVARNILPGINIEVIECSTAAAGLGLVTLNAARLADNNGTMEDLISTTDEIMPRVKIYAALDTLEYLSKSGRVPQVAARVNSVLNLKPVFTLNHGDARMVSLPTNTKNAARRIMKLLEKEVAGARLHAAVMHADAPNPAQELLEQVSERFRCEEIFLTEFTPVMGTHTGPGLFGVAFYTEPSDT
jgi:DegV family protein with EDD domain